MSQKIPCLVWILAFLLPLVAAEKTADLEKRVATTGEKERLPLLIQLGIDYSQSDIRKSMLYGQQALTLAQHSKDAASEAKAHQIIGNGMLISEQPESGLTHFRAAAAIYRRLNDRMETARSTLYIGNILSDLGRLTEAAAVLKETLAFYQGIKLPRGIATAAQNLGAIYSQLGDYPQALQYQLLALKTAEAMGEKQFQANSLNSIGNIHDSLGDHAQSLEYTRRAHRLFSEVNDRFGIASSLGNIGKSYWELGQRREALQNYQKSLAVAREIGNRYLGGVAISNMAVIYMQDKQYDKSIAMFREAAEIDRATKRSGSLAVSSSISASATCCWAGRRSPKRTTFKPCNWPSR